MLLSATFVLLSPILKQVLSQSPPFGLCHVIALALALDGISAFSTHSSYELNLPKYLWLSAVELLCGILLDTQFIFSFLNSANLF